MNIISSKDIPQPAGHYCHAIEWHNLVFTSGQLPVRFDGSHAQNEPFEIQVRQVLKNIEAVLTSSGSSIEQVLKTTVYIVDVNNWPKLNAVYAEFFRDHKPARSVVPVPALHHGYLIEIEVIAHRNQ